VIDLFLLNVQRAVFQQYSGREQVQYYMYINLCRNGLVKRINDFWLPLKRYGELV